MAGTLTDTRLAVQLHHAPGGVSHRPARRRGSTDPRRINWWATALIAVCSITVLVPLYLAVVTALKTPDQVGGTGFELPAGINWQNFLDAWTLTKFPQAPMNTALITVGAVVLTLLTHSLVAYAIARNLHKPFCTGIYFYLLSAVFFPFPIIMLPVIKETALLGLDNPLGLVLLCAVFGLSLNVFIYVAFIKSIPIELEEAAYTDRAGTWRVYRQIIFPLLTPMNAPVGIRTCVWAWNDFILPLVQFVFQGQFNTNYPAAFASSLMATAPLLIVYVFAQRWVISGVMRGSIK